MSTATVHDNAGPSHTDHVRDTMSIANILTPNNSPDMKTQAAILQAPSTPDKQIAIYNDEAITPPDTVMSGAAETDDGETDDTGEEAEETDDQEAKDLPDEEREFICMNDLKARCITGQYTLSLSRKVISDHFGRNKACTRDITDWPLFCRKHYQRATYNKKLWQIRKLDLIHRQFDVIEAQFPGTTYDIVFKKSEEARLNRFSRMITAGMPEDKARHAVLPRVGKHFEAPIDILRELYLETGNGKSIGKVKEITEIILKMLQDESTEQVPSIEFLPQLPNKKASPKKAVKAPKTPSPKKGRKAKTPSSKGTPGHVSAKGSVKKPGKDSKAKTAA